MAHGVLTKDLLEDGKRGWESLNIEYCYWVPQADIEGRIPEELHGTFFRNGPGLSEVYGKKLKHRKYLKLSFCL